MKGGTEMKKRPLICVVTADCSRNLSTCSTVNGVIKQAEECGCDTAILTTMCSYSNLVKMRHLEEKKRIFDLIASPHFDGYIYCKSTAEMDDSFITGIEGLLRSTNRYVMVADGSGSDIFDYTQSDDFDSFRSIVDHLIEVHGFSRIYCLTGTKGSFQAEERLKGYLDSMTSHGLEVENDWYEYGDFWTEKPREYARRLISGGLPLPEAVACGSDVMAYTLIEALRSGGIRVPEDIAVTGYDGMAVPGDAFITLTTYRRDNFRLGADCMRRLYRYITGRVCGRATGGESGFIQGCSCGCSGTAAYSGRARRDERLSTKARERMEQSDMIYNLASAGSLEEIIRIADNYIYLITKLRHFNIFLTEQFITAAETGTAEALDFGCRTRLVPVYRKTAGRIVSSAGEAFPAEDILSMFTEVSGKPRAFYLTPINFDDRFFGIAALSFGKVQFGYDSVYVKFISCLGQGLDRFLLSTGIDRERKHDSNDTAAGLPDVRKLSTYLREGCTGRRKLLVCCEVSDLHRLIGRYGGSKTAALVCELGQNIVRLLQQGEEVFTVSINCFVIVLDSELRSAEFFEELKKVSSGIPTGFTFGEFAFIPGTVTDEDRVNDLIGAAMSNTVRTYRFRSNGSRDLCDRLTELRRDMQEHPEQQWNTEDICAMLHVSKSTLQKNYRSSFGRSVIDELIDFRMDKAKKLLMETELSVADIASQCGYSTDSYFMKQFKKTVGVTPTEFRHKNM